MRFNDKKISINNQQYFHSLVIKISASSFSSYREKVKKQKYIVKKKKGLMTRMNYNGAERGLRSVQ